MSTGDIVSQFNAPPQATGNGRAIAFDGQFLYLTISGQRKIHKVTTSGTFVASFNTRINYGALKFDCKENVLWAGGYEGTFEIDKISLTGAVLATFNYSTFPLNPDLFNGFVDGITIDTLSDTILFSTDLGTTVYRMSKTGVFLGKFGTPPIGNLANGLNSGLEADSGCNLWFVLFETPSGPVQIVGIDINGNEIARFSTGSYLPEDIEFDPVTFAPLCVLWSNEATFGQNRIRAWEIPCLNVLCPEANPQKCCQVVIEHKTQLVPPARRGSTRVDKEICASVEKVCPEKVVIRGFLKKRIRYTTQEGRPRTIIDEIPFQCFIDRDDANEDDRFIVVGKTVLCTVFEREANFGGPKDRLGRPTLAFKLVEKEILKICVRKCSGLCECQCDDLSDSVNEPSVTIVEKSLLENTPLASLPNLGEAPKEEQNKPNVEINIAKPETSPLYPNK